jgi:acetyltransferase-like isoleucine patch superfamily enzyme
MMSLILLYARTIWYRFKYQHILRKAHFDKGVKIDTKLVITGPGKVYMGKNILLLKSYFESSCVTINTHKPEALVLIENDTILRGTRIGCHKKIVIGSDCVIENAYLIDSDFHNKEPEKRDKDYNINDRPVLIESNCYIGMEAVCAKETKLKEGTFVLPHSIILSRSR